MKIKIITLGCRLNQAEIESVSTELQLAGHEITDKSDADFVIINSCSVTQRSEKKVRALIKGARRSAEGSDPGIIVTGCASDEIKNDGWITYISNDYKYLIPEIVEKRKTGSKEPDYSPSRFNYCVPVKSSTIRANLKIQDGCDNFCSYCVIPYHRGGPQSKPAEQVLRELTQLIENGFKEIIFTGVNIGKYDNNGKYLASLMDMALDLDGDFRLHLTSLDPDRLTDELIDLLSHPKMVRHLHLSLQSGSDSVLERMNRPYRRKDYVDAVQKIREKMKGFNLTTDVIVGFPGETETEFRDTLSLAEEAGFSHIHTFRYSPRPGTNAFDMGDSIAEEIKKQRSRELISLSNKLKDEYLQKFNSAEGIFLSERSRQGATRGFNEYYVPVEVEALLESNRFYKIRTFAGTKKGKLSGSVI